MTCIVGIVRDGDVAVGGDRAGVSGWDVTLCRDPKVFRIGAGVVGGTTSFRMLDVLQYDAALRLPSSHDSETARAYLVTEWVPKVRAAFKESGFLKIENNREEGGSFLVGWLGCLFLVDANFLVLQSNDGYFSVGSGESVALGALAVISAMRASGDLEGSVEGDVRLALEAAAAHNIGVRGPFDIIVLRPTTWS